MPSPSEQSTPESHRAGDAAESAYERLRELIVTGVYSPNERLTHRELSDRLEVGRTPIRQALHRLEADRLVTSVPNRGVRVAGVAVGDAEELYAARLILEPPLMSAVAGQLTTDELGRMRAELDRMSASIYRVPEFQVAHRDFHLVAAFDYSSHFIADLVIRVHRHLFRHQQAYMSRPRVPEDFLGIDQALLSALEDGNSAAARRIYEFHLIDMAIGMVLDVDPDHAFDVLLRVAAANEIHVAASEDGRIVRPALLRWTRKHIDLPVLVTTNLRISGAGDGRGITATRDWSVSGPLSEGGP